MRRILLLGAAIAVAAFAGTSARATAAVAPSWALLPIGPFPGCSLVLQNCDNDIWSSDVNSKGWVAGGGFPDFHRAWIWKGGSMIQLGTGGGAFTAGAGVTAMNDAGDVTGEMEDFGGIRHAYLHVNGSAAFTDIGTLGGAQSRGEGIDAHDVVVGSSDTAAGRSHAFRWAGGAMTDLGTLGGPNSQATAIAPGGLIAGSAQTATGHWHAFLIRAGHMNDLGSLGALDSFALSVNSAGTVVGYSETRTGIRKGFVLRNGHRTDVTARLNAAGLSAASSVAADITDAGDVVGSATRPDGTRFGYVITGGTVLSLDRRTVTCCAEVRPGALNGALQIASDGDIDQFTAKVWEPVKVVDDGSPALVYAGHWARSASSGAWLGHVHTSTHAGDSVALSFMGRRVWWVAPMGVGGGIARVFVDGAPAATVDLSETPTGIHRRQTAFLRSWPAAGHHTIKVVVGTRVPRVDVDAFAVSMR
jgi:probable HAF family extracellular repeat protein